MTLKAQRIKCWKLIQAQKGVRQFTKAQKGCLLSIVKLHDKKKANTVRIALDKSVTKK